MYKQKQTKTPFFIFIRDIKANGKKKYMQEMFNYIDSAMQSSSGDYLHDRESFLVYKNYAS